MRITASGNGAFQVPKEAAKEDGPLAEQKKWFREMRWSVMAEAAVVAWTAYRAALNPPGGFWRDDNGQHHAGDPVLRDTHWARYAAFYYLNATALVTSMLIMVLLMSERLFHHHGEARVVALMVAVFVDLGSFAGAYIVGTASYAIACVYIVVVVFVYVIYLAKLEWCRPADVVTTKSLP